MKALSLLQPWASLIVLGHKRIETRSWNTKYRGPLLIHASANRKIGKQFAGEPYFRDCIPKKGTDGFDAAIIDWDGLPFGAIIGMVNLMATCTVERLRQAGRSYPILHDLGPSPEATHRLTHQEEAFGDYSLGRFGWLLSNPILFPEPIPRKGALSIWTVPEAVLPEINSQIQLVTA